MQDSRQSVSSLLRLYLGRSDLAEGSQLIVGRAVRWFIEYFGDLPGAEVTRELAEDYKRMLIKNNKRSKSAANFYIGVIGPFFRWLVAEQYIGRDPFARVRRYKGEQQVRQMFSREDITRMIKVADPRWKVLVLLSAACSLRRSEAMNLCRSDIKGNWLHIRGKRRTKDNWEWAIKNHAQLLVPMPRELTAAITELLRTEVPTAQPYVCVPPRAYRRNMHLMAENSLTYELRNCPYGNFNRHFKALMGRAWVEPNRFQDLRGCYANALKDGGMDAIEISRQMRHSSVATTEKFYLRYDLEKLAVRSQQAISKFYGFV
jgi:integrase